jgi:putative acetyltransferase
MVGWQPTSPGTVELQRLYVARRWRRLGVAATLAGRVERAALDRSAERIELWSDSRFADAHRFYERHGYVRSGPDRHLGDLSQTVERHYEKALR